jgi:hypothetical protein
VARAAREDGTARCAGKKDTASPEVGRGGKKQERKTAQSVCKKGRLGKERERERERERRG